MISELDLRILTPSMIHDVAFLAIRVIPDNATTVVVRLDSLYELFNNLYGVSHPNVKKNDFCDVFREIFPVYKNPRKSNRDVKITVHKLDERLSELGLKNFPLERLMEMKELKLNLETSIDSEGS